MSNADVHFIIVLLAAVTILSTTSAGGVGNGGSQPVVEDGAEYVPVQEEPLAQWKEGFGVGVLQEKFPPFRTCGPCKCCAPDDPNSCKQTQCCFGIKCHLPGKPKDTCALVPVACHCDNCK